MSGTNWVISARGECLKVTQGASKIPLDEGEPRVTIATIHIP
jgi:hypothetical protein